MIEGHPDINDCTAQIRGAAMNYRFKSWNCHHEIDAFISESAGYPSEDVKVQHILYASFLQFIVECEKG